VHTGLDKAGCTLLSACAGHTHGIDVSRRSFRGENRRRQSLYVVMIRITSAAAAKLTAQRKRGAVRQWTAILLFRPEVAVAFNSIEQDRLSTIDIERHTDVQKVARC